MISYQGKPLTDSSLTLYSRDGDDEGKFQTDAAGRVHFTSQQLRSPGPDPTAPAALPANESTGDQPAAGEDAFSRSSRLHRPLVEPLASFGASVLGEYLYVFSGHAGQMHTFGKDMLVDHFRRIRFDDPEAQWEELAMHQPGQSVALVNDGQQWIAADRLLVPRMFLRLLPVGDDRLIAVGGTTSNGSGRLAVIESLTVDADQTAAPKSVRWTIPYAGQAKHAQIAVLDNYQLYLFGGNASWAAHEFSPSAILSEAVVFDLINQTSELLPPLPRLQSL